MSPAPSTLEWFQQPFPPLSTDSVETILGRMVADATAGIDPRDPAYPDLIVGSIASDLLAGCATEMDRIRDLASNEVPRAGVPTLAQGPYLDAWAEALQLENGAGGVGRKDASAASGVVVFTGDQGTVIDTGTKVSTESITPDVDPIVFATTEGGTIDGSLGVISGVTQGVVALSIKASSTGADTNVLANTITLMQSPTDGVASVTNPAPSTAGADVESDDALQRRVGQSLSGSEGSGTISDYERWFLGELGVGFVTVQPCWNGPTSVRVQITDLNNNPFTDPGYVSALQAKYDPTPGRGHGIAPIGHFLTVATPLGVGLALNATLDFDAGYSYDGAGGTRATRPQIMAALGAYFAGLKAGDTVVFYAVIAALMDVVGVQNVASLTFAYITSLSAHALTTDTALQVVNSYGFQSADHITVGSTAAILSVAPPDSTHLDLTVALGVAHALGDPVIGPAAGGDHIIASDEVAVLATVTLA